MNREKFALTIAFLAGLMDSLSGLTLILAPSLALFLMGIDPERHPLDYQRFIGGFVFGVGGLYLWAWQRGRFGDWSTFSTLWLATAWTRLCVGCVTAGLVLSGSLEIAWISVPLSDLGLALFQFWWRWSGRLSR